MGFTDHCDLFASVHEEGINRIIGHIQRKRPSLFNYGTMMFVKNPKRMCHEIGPVDPDVIKRNNPIVTLEPPIPIPGSFMALDWCMQIPTIQIDFHPGKLFQLPPELTSPLPKQRMALHIEVCGGVGVPRVPDKLPFPDDTGGKIGDGIWAPARDLPTVVFPSEKICCFCLDAYAVAGASIVNNKLEIDLEGFEIVDIKPDGLECSIETFVSLTIKYGLLPRLRIALDQLVFDLGTYATIALAPTPISANVPNNPSIANDSVSAFIDVTIT